MDFAQIQAEYEARFIVCSRCGKNTGNAHQGHYWQFCKVLGKMADKFHLCCPGDCELYEQDGTRKQVPSPDMRQEIQRRVDEAKSAQVRTTMDGAVALAAQALQHDAKPLDAAEAQRVARIAVEASAAVLCDMGRLEANNAITWDTSCLNCSTLLDGVYAETVRRERAEDAVKDLLAVCHDLITLYWVPKEERAGRMPLADQHRERAERARLVLGETGD